MVNRLWVVGLSALLMACGGKSIVGSSAGQAEADDGSSGADGSTPDIVDPAGGSGGGPLGGSGGIGEAPDAAQQECTPAPEGSGGFQQPTCAQLNGLRVEQPSLSDDSGDGVLSPGESGTLQVDLREVAGEDFMYYPGVKFTTSHPGVEVTSEGWLYGIFACTSTQLTASLRASPEVAPGTVAVITAQVAMLSDTCPQAPALDIPILVE